MKKHISLIFAIVLFLVLPAWAGPKVALVYTTQQSAKLEAGEKDPLLTYRSAIEENGAEVIVFAQGEPESEISRKLGQLDAVLLPGGIDVDPKFYDEPPHENLEKVDVALDELEFSLLRYADEQELPVLGICRGEQIMNVHYGGSLIQDIPSHLSNNASVVHRYPKSSKEQKEHIIYITPGTRLHDLFGVSELVVNTYHHQAVKRPGKGIVVSARSADGIVEAIELEGERFVVGVQFHPEKLRKTRPQFNCLFEKFIAEAAK